MDTIINQPIFLLDDSDAFIESILFHLKNNGISEIIPFNDLEKFYDSLDDKQRIYIVDYFLKNKVKANDVIVKILQHNKRSKIIVISLYPNVDIVIDCFNLGAFKYFPKSADGFVANMVEAIKQASELITKDQEFLDTIKR